jgi:hypothetical protein
VFVTCLLSFVSEHFWYPRCVRPNFYCATFTSGFHWNMKFLSVVCIFVFVVHLYYSYIYIYIFLIQAPVYEGVKKLKMLV